MWGWFRERISGFVGLLGSTRQTTPVRPSGDLAEQTLQRLHHLTPKQQRAYPWDCMRKMLETALADLQNGEQRPQDLERFNQTMEAIEQLRHEGGDDWDQSGTAAIVGVVIQELLQEIRRLTAKPRWFRRGQSINGADRSLVVRALVEKGFAIFCDFRRISMLRVPHQRPLLEEVARLKLTGARAVYGYLEYLSDPDAAGGTETEMVTDALKNACRLDLPAGGALDPADDPRRLNQRVADTLKASWAWLNLMQLAWQTGDFSTAREHLKQSGLDRSRPSGRHRWTAIAGAIHRELDDSGEAAEWFAAAAADPQATVNQRRRSRIDEIEARIVLDERGLREDSEYDTQATRHRWAGWLEELHTMLQAPAANHALPRHRVLQLMIRVGERIQPSSRLIGQIAPHLQHLNGELTVDAAIIRLLAQSGSEAIHDQIASLPLTARAVDFPDETVLSLGEWMLMTGLISRFEALIARPHHLGDPARWKPSAERPELTCLHALHQMVCGNGDPTTEVKAVLASSPAPELAHRLRLHAALSQRDRGRARQLNGHPMTALLPWTLQQLQQIRSLALDEAWPEAEQQFVELLDQEPDSPRVLLEFGLAALDAGQDDTAEQCFRRIMGIDHSEEAEGADGRSPLPWHISAAVGLLMIDSGIADRHTDESNWQPDLDRLHRQEPELHLLLEGWLTRFQRAGRQDLAAVMETFLHRVNRNDTRTVLSLIDDRD